LCSYVLAGAPAYTPEEIIERKLHKMPKDAFGYRVLTAAEIPDLKGAPGQAIVEGQNISHAKLLGKEYRPIQCLRCGGFGHNGIDRQGLTLVHVSAQLELFCPPYNPTQRSTGATPGHILQLCWVIRWTEELKLR